MYAWAGQRCPARAFSWRISIPMKRGPVCVLSVKSKCSVVICRICVILCAIRSLCAIRKLNAPAYFTPLLFSAAVYLAALARCSLYVRAKLCVPEKSSLAHIYR